MKNDERRWNESRGVEIKVVQNIDKNYYLESYSEWLKFRSKFKKWEARIGVLSFLVAFLVYMFDEKLFYISGGLTVYGVLMIYGFFSTKKKWMQDRINSKMNDSKFTMIFEDDNFKSIGPFTEMTGKWGFFKDAIETEKGVFLIPENGISIYLQKISFENQLDVNRIIGKIKEN